MADNRHRYGFRYHSPRYGNTKPPTIMMSIATGQNDVDDSANSININIGDPVEKVNTGGVIVANVDEVVWGIVVGPILYWDGDKMRKGKYYPNQTAWGTVEGRRGYVGCMTASAAVWEVDCDENATDASLASADKAGYMAIVGENIQHTCPGDTTNGTADPYLDLSDHATTYTHGWRIVGVSETLENQDYSGNYVKLLVVINESQEAGAARGADNSIVAGV
jgi:hypothetical protein